jgi:glycosyltransferase involved in cell wall biosynthesis
MAMHKLSVVIIAHNEEAYIADAIRSALFADEVLVLDSGSTDNTIEISKNLGATVMQQKWLGFGPQKNRAVALAKNDFVFVLDSDERITDLLRDEIVEIMKAPKSDGYFVARLNNFWGNDIKTCGLYPDYSLRLFNRTKAKFNDVPVHESVQLTKNVAYLKNHMYHLAYKSIEEFISKQNRYSTLHDKKKSIIKAIINPYWTFFKLFILKKGFMDGWDGFVIAKLYAQYTFWKYVK